MLPNRIILGVLLSCLLVVFKPAAHAGGSLRASVPLQKDRPTPEQLNLPAHFRQLVQDRTTIDDYQNVHHQVEPGVSPTPVVLRSRSNPRANVIRIVAPTTLEEATIREERETHPVYPLPGFRAVIAAGETTPGLAPPGQFFDSSPGKSDVSSLILDRLAIDGILRTLAQVLDQLGPHRFVTNGAVGLMELENVGFPQDLLACFASKDYPDPAEASIEVVQYVAQMLDAGDNIYTVDAGLNSLDFRWPQAWTGFQVAGETGTHELGMLRMQLGSGYAKGIIPGDSIDLLYQFVRGLKRTDFLVTVPSELTEPIGTWAGYTLPLTRRNQLTLVSQPTQFEEWAQDNGKAGFIQSPFSGRQVFATLTPRYASRGEGVSQFLPNESYLMENLEATGHSIQRFPLLFQGGNMLPVLDPETGERTLLIGEGLVHRNTALGLTSAQILTAFRVGLGMDECVVVPGLSYHLDFDVNVREVDGELVAFVNDPKTAVRAILKRGTEAFEESGLITHETAVELHRDIATGNGALAHERLSSLVRSEVDQDGVFAGSTASLFKTAGVDLAEGNLQVFLLALDLLACELGDANDPEGNPERQSYLQALQRMEQRRLSQIAMIESLGWRIVRVPSIHDLHRGINYLNGIHHKDGYLLPVFGGFYKPVDRLAEKVFRDTIGEGKKILRIQCAAIQRRHGAVHCVASAFPRIEPVAGSR